MSSLQRLAPSPRMDSSHSLFLAFVKDGEGRPEAVEEANAENNAELNIIGVVKNKYLFMSRPKPTKVQAAKHAKILRTWALISCTALFFFSACRNSALSQRKLGSRCPSARG